MRIYFWLTLITGLSFVFYGISCVFTLEMKSEFERFKLVKWRVTTGVLQLIGGFGLVIGVFTSDLLVLLSAIGLACLMLLGFITRLRIKDGILVSSPALIFMILNTLIAVFYYTLI